MKIATPVLLFLALAAGCGSPTPQTTPTPDPSAAAALLPKVRFPSGTSVGVEFAVTPEERAQGLMFRESMATNHGMLFFFDPPSAETFWMKNCHFPIDIVWLDQDRRFISASYDTPPCRADPCPTYPAGGPASFVLEVAAGVARNEKLKPGDQLDFLEMPAKR